MDYMKWAGWALAAVLFVAVIALVLDQQSARRVMNDLRVENTSLQKDVEQLREEAKLARARSAPVRPPKDTPRPARSTSTAVDTVQEAPMDSASLPKSSGENPLRALLGGPQGQQFARMGARIGVDTQYGAWLTEMNFPPDVEARVREILMEEAVASVDAGIASVQGGARAVGDPLDAHAAAKQRAREQLAEILTPEELASLEDYEGAGYERAMAQSFDMQLAMYGDALSAEARELIKQTLLEELPDFQTPDPGSAFGIADVLSQQRDAMLRALERLGAELDETQYAIAERFVQQQIDMQEAMSEMMSGMFEPETNSSAP